MKTKSQCPNNLNLKFIIICFFLIFLIFLIQRSTLSPPPRQQTPPPSVHASKASPEKQDSPGNQESPPGNQEPCNCAAPRGTQTTCGKIPPSLANSLVHYATNNRTPQQTLKEISVTMRVLERKSPCKFLVFGLGRDSLMWESLNHGGRTVFLEENPGWIILIHQQFPSLEAYHVTYDTKKTQAEELLEMTTKDEECKVVGDPRSSKCRLAIKGMPKEVYATDWDLIMVDAPTAWNDDAPGRMSAIYTAGLIARNRKEGETDIFVHDVDRDVEDKFSMSFLCEGYMVEEEGLLRHFTIPSHRISTDRPFCPLVRTN